MQILIRAVLAQILTVVANILALCLVSAIAMILSPFSTKYSMFVHLANQPFIDQLRMAFTSFTKKRYMIGQDGRKPIGSWLGMMFLAFTGLVVTFISTAVYQASHMELKNTENAAPALLDSTNMVVKDRYGNNDLIKYPVIGDAYLGPKNAPGSGFPEAVLPTEFWNNDIGHSVQTESQFSGNVSVSLGDANWLSITGNNGITTTVLMSIDGITAESLPSASPGTINLQILDNGSPALFTAPMVSQPQGLAQQNTYAFAVAGLHTLDYVQFSLIKFDSQVWSQGDNLDLYYQYLSDQNSFTNENGTSMFNYTYNYDNKQTYDKDNLESDMQQTGDNEVKYSLIGLRNTTAKTDLFQSYALTKRSVYRESSVKSVNNTINLVEFHYQVQITRYSRPAALQDTFKVRYTGGKHSGAGVTLPLTPMFTTSQLDFVNMASLTATDRIYASFTPETYIDILPLIILMAVYGGLTIILSLCSYSWNFKRFANKAYSLPLESLNYLLYNPGTALIPLFQKVRRAELAMVDGYDPTTGYNHVGLVSPDDAARIARAEPDVPYGLIYKSPSGMLDPQHYQ